MIDLGKWFEERIGLPQESTSEEEFDLYEP
jgi:endogenous inhibitor of DNA gyrase (YacG/DUF329 family)